MQILPLATQSAKSAADTSVTSSADLAKRQSALFASLLDSARSDAASIAGQSETSSAASSTVADTATAGPSDQDLVNLPVTREDIAALHDDLKAEGFSDEELSAMQDRADSPTGLTWREVMDEVKKKVSKTEATEKKEVSNDDKVELLGLFGKLGFTPAESQNLIDSLAKGETEAVWAAVNQKVAGLPSDGTVSLGSTEMTALARAMNLSEDGQKRLAALFDQSNAASGLAGQGLATAMSLVKNELVAQIGKENQALADFRQKAAGVMAQAWQRETGKKNSDLHQDDVARKAAQVVAMNSGKDKTSDVPTASQPSVDVLADVPAAGAGQAQQESQTHQARQAGQAGSDGSAKTAADLASRAGAVAADQALASGQNGQADPGQQAGTPATPRTPVSDKAVAAALQTAGRDAGNFTGNQQGGAGGTFDHADQEAGWGAFWSKVRTDKISGQTTSAGQSTATQTMAAMDAVAGAGAGKTAKTFDPALAARAARQLETGILRNVGGDAKQLTLHLSPDELGKLSVTLTVKDKEVRAVIMADNSDTAAMLQDQAAKIKQTLEDQGFKVTKLDVQTGLAQDNQGTWQSPEQHNLAREQREAVERMRSSLRLARDGGTGFGAEDAGFTPATTASRAAGLDLFA
ncbi:Flagellar hook-length control protein-like protein [Solidesulfovibrio carbinoliphilus subsp. oakridgensis]|uniref:Flagellar hook-length control protein-like protein n=1 Tax=Solidesulfovibrio carbinoliphilus subsp. oakridgensis TaxID=694327 RepID=G7QCT1_9BACT|nr:flagellar hook-length control protein FliK [Solidesulfovibrio carbinoliphilus]EHJ46237.1 Flagellar hook-length control protein-like protein [Solidesulfovibrio carbinoliphilus subsp. oakridgensis]